MRLDILYFLCYPVLSIPRFVGNKMTVFGVELLGILSSGFLLSSVHRKHAQLNFDGCQYLSDSFYDYRKHFLKIISQRFSRTHIKMYCVSYQWVSPMETTRSVSPSKPSSQEPDTLLCGEYTTHTGPTVQCLVRSGGHRVAHIWASQGICAHAHAHTHTGACRARSLQQFPASVAGNDNAGRWRRGRLFCATSTAHIRQVVVRNLAIRIRCEAFRLQRTQFC